ncbi:ExbD/TolR family protein, partial [Thiocystis violacea]
PPVVLTYGKDGKIELDGQSYRLEQIVEAVEAKLGDDRTPPIHLRADRDAAYGDVIGLMDVLAAQGLTRLAILTGPAGKSKAAKIDKAAPGAPAPRP